MIGELNLEYLGETNKAVHVSDGYIETHLPKSEIGWGYNQIFEMDPYGDEIKITRTKGDSIVLEIPDWLVLDRGLSLDDWIDKDIGN